MAENLFFDNPNLDRNIKQTIQEKLIEIQNFKNNGNTIRTKNKNLEKIYDIGREINKNEEIKKGNMRNIYKLQNSTGITENQQEIFNTAKNFYQNLYKSQNIKNNKIDEYLNNFKPEKLNEQQKHLLSTFISTDEIKLAINNMNINKSPGEDGLTAEFYKTFQDKLIPILQEVYLNIFLSDSMPKNMKMGIINLIYKNKGNVEDLKNWRPITLLNVDYKILTKILTERLKNQTENIINNLQSCGCKNRSIINNALNIQTIINYIQKENYDAALISFDQEKAFDRVEHNFIIKALEKYDFPENFIKWIKILYSNIKSKIIINGKFTEEIFITRSVRQGCPLSMFIYAIILEPLVYKINQNEKINGLRIPNFGHLKILQHADDMSSFISNKTSYNYLIQEFITYGQYSGSKINENKTEILPFGKWILDKNNLPNQYIRDKIKIFGIIYGNNQENFKNTINNLKYYINNWEKYNLNLKEKINVINIYIQSQLQYQLI